MNTYRINGGTETIPMYVRSPDTYDLVVGRSSITAGLCVGCTDQYDSMQFGNAISGNMFLDAPDLACDMYVYLKYYRLRLVSEVDPELLGDTLDAARVIDRDYIY